MEYEHEKDNLQPTYDQLKDFSLFPPEVLNRDFNKREDGALTMKDLQDVILALNKNMESVAEMDSTLVEDNNYDDNTTDDVAASQPIANADTSGDSTDDKAEENTVKEDDIVNDSPQVKKEPEKTNTNSNTDSVNSTIIKDSKTSEQDYKKILQFTNRIEATFKYRSLAFQQDDEEIKLLNKIKSDVSTFKNHNEFIWFMHYFIVKRGNNIGEELYLLFELIYILPHPFRYLYLIDYEPFGKKNGYGYYVRDLARALNEYCKRNRHLPFKYIQKQEHTKYLTKEIENMLSCVSYKKIISDDIIDTVNELKNKMVVFTDYLSMVKFLYKENKTCNLDPAGYLLLNMIYILPNPAKYLYLLHFRTDKEFMIKFINDIG